MRRREGFEVRLHPTPVTGAPFVRVNRGRQEFLQVPERLAATVVGDGWRAVVRTGLDELDEEAALVIEEITVTRTGNTPMSELLRRLPIGQILDEIVQAGSLRWVRDPDRNRWVLDMAAGRLPAATIAIRRGRRPETARIDAEVENVARLWPQARDEPAPVRYLAGQLGLSYRTAQRRLSAAYDRGLIE